MEKTLNDDELGETLNALHTAILNYDKEITEKEEQAKSDELDLDAFSNLQQSILTRKEMRKAARSAFKKLNGCEEVVIHSSN
ncbi:hypothetical protein [Pontibacter mangrovi]|uniref:Uncharacterized protein n=1 Tax=Pontibacter mangrovi TaxID=2589816 RepID=A0A501W4T4_9BACT|nr:hypothetical protein [Pontibacter mangrovi]TPE44953.1 hypothetical protein FJM65_08025 [Pontibacter mangrovi]